MEIIPAIDLQNGKCVRLLQGKEEATTEYSHDAVAVAAEWVQQGARRLHIVNLDGAFGRASNNIEIVKRIADEVDGIIEFGGGLRTMHDIEQAIHAGVQKVVLGTAAIEDPEFLSKVVRRIGSERVIVALDGMNGKVATHGWQTVSDMNVVEFAKSVHDHSVTEILYTDIQRDGMLTGLDYETLEQLASIGLNVIASGGVSSNADVIKLLDIGSSNIVGVIIGKALYERRVLLPALLEDLGRH